MRSKSGLIGFFWVLFFFFLFLLCGFSAAYWVFAHFSSQESFLAFPSTNQTGNATVDVFSILHTTQWITRSAGLYEPNSKDHHYLRRKFVRAEIENQEEEPSSPFASQRRAQLERRLTSPDGCDSYVQWSDFDESETLNENEFFVLVNLLADRFLADTFQELPETLQTRFDTLASGGSEIHFGTTKTDSYSHSNVFQHSPTVGITAASKICDQINADLDSLSTSTTTTTTTTTTTLLLRSQSNTDKLRSCARDYAPQFDTDGDGDLSVGEFAILASAVARSNVELSFLELPESVQNIFLAQVAREGNPFEGVPVDPDLPHPLVVSFDGICDRLPQIEHSMIIQDDLDFNFDDIPSSQLDALFQNDTDGNTEATNTTLDTPDETEVLPEDVTNTTEPVETNNNTIENEALNGTDTSANTTEEQTPTNNTTDISQGNSSTPFPNPPTENATFTNTTEPPQEDGTATFVPSLESSDTGAPSDGYTDTGNTDSPFTSSPTSPPLPFPNSTTEAPTEAPLENATTLPGSTPPPTPQATASLPATPPPTTIAPITIAPTALPTTPPAPTPAPGPSERVTVYNAWEISNAVGQTADDLTADLVDYNGIKSAYAAFTNDIVMGMAASRNAKLRLRRRRLAVSKGESRVSLLIDSKCPPSAPPYQKCVTAYGWVVLVVTDENTDVVAAEYQDNSQLAIASGELQEKFEAEVPGTVWVITGSPSSPLNPLKGLPEPPSDPPVADRGGADLDLGLIVSGSIAAFLVVIVVLFVIIPACRKNRDLKEAKKEALWAIREAEAKLEAALKKKQEREKKEEEGPKGPPWPKHDHDEGDNPYREEVERLIELHCPELMDEVDSLLHQYQGREEELIAMLEDFGGDESVLDSDSEVEISSVESESESVSVADESVDDDVPMAEIEVEEPTEVEVANNVDVDDDDASKSLAEESVEIEVEEVDAESVDEAEDEEEIVEVEDELSEEDYTEEEEEEEEEEESESCSSHGIFIIPRSCHGLEPPDDDAMEVDDSRRSKYGDPPDDTETQLEPEDEDDVFESLSEPPPDPDSESEQDPDPEPAPVVEPETPKEDPPDIPREEPPVDEPPPLIPSEPEPETEEEEEPVVEEDPATPEPEERPIVPPPEPEKPKPQPKQAVVEREEEDATAQITDVVSDHESWLSSDSEDGYRIRWFQRNGYWISEKVPIEDDFSDSTEYDSDSDESEAERAFKWVNNGKEWRKESVESLKVEGSLLDDESYDSSSSDFDSDEDAGPKWVQQNGRWQPEPQIDEASLGYSDD